MRKDFDPVGVLLLDSAKVRVVTLGSEEFLELETARRGKKRVFDTAKAGDTLAKVGRRYGLTAGDLARINRFSYNTELHDGQKIVVYSPTGEAPREVTMGLTPEAKRSDGKRPVERRCRTARARRWWPKTANEAAKRVSTARRTSAPRSRAARPGKRPARSPPARRRTR